MKHILVGLLAGLAMIVLGACNASNSPTLEATTALPSQSTPISAAPTPVPTPNIQQVEVMCPTDNEEAAHLYNEANQLVERGGTEQAQTSFLKALDLDPNYCDAMDNLGLLLRAQGEIEEAIKWYERSIQIKPDNTVAHLNLAAAYSMQGKPAKALDEYKLLIKIAPDNPEGYYGLGNIYLTLEQPDEAIPHLKKAEELYAQQSSPWIVDARAQLGHAYFLSEEYRKAVDYLNLVYAQMSDSPQVNYLLGVSYLSSEVKDVEQAKKYLSKARDLGVTLAPELTQLLDK